MLSTRIWWQTWGNMGQPEVPTAITNDMVVERNIKQCANSLLLKSIVSPVLRVPQMVALLLLELEAFDRCFTLRHICFTLSDLHEPNRISTSQIESMHAS